MAEKHWLLGDTHNAERRADPCKVKFSAFPSRGARLVDRLHLGEPDSGWRRISLPALTRLYRHPKVMEERVTMRTIGYAAVAVDSLLRATISNVRPNSGWYGWVTQKRRAASLASSAFACGLQESYGLAGPLLDFASA